jgi:hypothetical protein
VSNSEAGLYDLMGRYVISDGLFITLGGETIDHLSRNLLKLDR